MFSGIKELKLKKAKPKKKPKIRGIELSYMGNNRFLLWIYYKNECGYFEYKNIKDAVHDFKILVGMVK
jgi:hypothetical protein